MTTDLAPINLQVSLANPPAAADMIRYIGMLNLPDVQPPEQDEDPAQYYAMMWPELSQQQKGQAVYVGGQRAAEYRQAFDDGLQLMIFQAYISSLWLETMEGDGGDTSFRYWVRDVIVADGQSTTEATQLASTILNLTWLEANGFTGLPDDLETIFYDRTTYNRWRRVASGLRGLIEAAEEDESVDTLIQDLVDAVNDPEKDSDDLDEIGRKKPSVHKARINVSPHDDMGMQLISGVVTDAQLVLLRSNTKRVANFYLEGEEYGTEGYVLVQYRTTWSWGCDNCGTLFGMELDECPACKAGTINYLSDTSRRTFTESVWSDWDPYLEEELPKGWLDGPALIDGSQQVTYLTQWEKL